MSILPRQAARKHLDAVFRGSTMTMTPASSPARSPAQTPIDISVGHQGWHGHGHKHLTRYTAEEALLKP